MAASTLNLYLRLLGEFQVTVCGRSLPATRWEHRRASELVKLLALARGHRLTRDQVIEALWSHLTPDAGAAALHKAASQARASLGAPESVVVRGGEVALAPEGDVVTDAGRFETAARAALSNQDRDACARAAALYGGELLPTDRYASWTESSRLRLKTLHLQLLSCAGAWDEIVALDPTDERAHLSLMRLYAGAGNRAAALRQFRRLREILASELGVLPSPDAVALYEEIARGPAVNAPIAARLPIVGRKVELARALALLRSLRKERGATLLVRGDRGIGKTRFCEAILVRAREEGATTLRGEAFREQATHSFGPIVEALERLLAARPDLTEQLSPVARQALARLGVAATDAPRPLGRQPLLAAVAKLLSAAATERPVVLFLDDLHEADPSTIELVHYLSHIARFQRILLLCAYRPDPDPDVTRLRTQLIEKHSAIEIDLAPLQRSECAVLIERVLGRAPSSAELDSIHQRTGGNGFYVEALANSLATSGTTHVPGALWEVLEARIAALSEDVARALETLSILGDGFSTEEAVALLNTDEETVFSMLSRAVRARLLDEVSGGYQFHHALLREAIQRRVPAHKSRDLHRAAAQALSSVAGSAARIGRHWVHAGEPQAAVGWLTQAAQEHANAGAYQSALNLAEEAIERGGPEVELLALRAELLLATGAPEAPAAFDTAIRRARGRRRDRLRVGKAQAQIAIGEMDAARETLDELRPPEAAADRVRYLTARGITDWMRGNYPAVESVTREAMALANQERQPRALAEAAVVRITAAHMEGNTTARLSADLLDLSHPHELAAAIHEGYLCGVEFYLYGGRPYQEVAAFAEQLRAAGEQCGAQRAVALATCLLGETALLTGELSRAEALLEKSRQLSLDLRSEGAAALSVQRLAEAAWFAGNLDRARAYIADALELSRSSILGQRHLLLRVFGTKIRIEGDAKERSLAAVDEAELGIRGPFETCYGCTITFAVPAAIACARAGDPARARRYLETAQSLSQMFWQRGAWFAAVAEAEAAVSAAEGDRQKAKQSYQKAVDLFAQAGQRLDAARCDQALKSL